MAATTPPKWNPTILNPPPPFMPGPRHKSCIATAATTNTPCNNRVSSFFPADVDGPGLMNKEPHTIVRKDIHDPDSMVPDISSCLCNVHKKDAYKYANMWMEAIYAEAQRRENQQG